MSSWQNAPHPTKKMPKMKTKRSNIDPSIILFYSKPLRYTSYNKHQKTHTMKKFLIILAAILMCCTYSTDATAQRSQAKGFNYKAHAEIGRASCRERV